MSSMKFALMFFLAVPGCALATVSTSMGVITFSGALYQPGSNQTAELYQASSQESSDGQTSNLPTLLQLDDMQLIKGVSYSGVNWLDSEQRHGVMTVNYK